MRNRVVEWLEGEGILQKESAPEGTAWGYEISYPNQPFRALVVQPGDKPDLVVVLANQQIAPKLVERLEEMADDEYRRFEIDLRLDLNRRPPETGIVQNDKKRLWRLQHAYPLFEDGLGKDAFLRGVRSVFRNLLHVDLFLSRRLHTDPSNPVAFRLRPRESWLDLEDGSS